MFGSQAVGRVGLVRVSLTCLATMGTPYLAMSASFNILMIGNSYTQGNSAARATSLDLQGLFDGDSDYEASITVRADSGTSLFDHVRNPATTGLIANGTTQWDVIVLQERSNRPAKAMKYGGFELAGLDQGGPKLIEDYILPFQPQAHVVLFNTWARAVDTQDLIEEFDNDPAQMQAFTNQGYARMMHNSPAWDYSQSTTIADVGDAWAAWYESFGNIGTNNDLHLSDGTHQNNRGAYLAAAVLFETITGKSTVGNAYVGAVTGSIEGTSKALLLQQQATTITGAYPGPPGDYNGDGTVDAADYTVWRNNLGSESRLPNDHSPGVGPDDYHRWRDTYGNTLHANVAAATSVAEPATTCCLIPAVLVFVVRGSRLQDRWSAIRLFRTHC